jgi:hypothetical protein
LFKGLNVSTADIRDVLETEVIKRDALEGDRAESAAKSMRRASRKRARNSEEKVVPIKTGSTQIAVTNASEHPALTVPLSR